MKRGTRRVWLALALAGTLALALAATSGGVIKTKTFSTGTLFEPIPDPGTFSHSFRSHVKRSRVKDVNIGVGISHVDAEDLLISLTHRGTTVDLSSKNGNATTDDEAYGSGDASCDDELAVFNDEAQTSIEDGTDPFAGQFIPEDPLSAFDRAKVKGDWTLTIEDYAMARTGAFRCAELEVKYRKKKLHH